LRAPIALHRAHPRATVGVHLGNALANASAHMRALIADDDLIVTTILSNTLSRMGMHVTVAHDGDVAWQALNSLQPPGIALLDWMMPNIDGLELCRRIRSAPRLAG